MFKHGVRTRLELQQAGGMPGVQCRRNTHEGRAGESGCSVGTSAVTLSSLAGIYSGMLARETNTRVGWGDGLGAAG